MTPWPPPLVVSLSKAKKAKQCEENESGGLCAMRVEQRPYDTCFATTFPSIEKAQNHTRGLVAPLRACREPYLVCGIRHSRG